MESDSEDGQTPNSAGLDPLVEGRAPDGSLPQGEPVLAAPKDQVLDDPRDHGGIIIPTSNTGIYLPGEKVALSVKSGKKNGSLTPNQNGAFPMMVIVPNGKAELKLTYADLPVGTKIDLFCADGGTINGESKLSTELDAAGSVTVTWQGNKNLGYHSVTYTYQTNGDLNTVTQAHSGNTWTVGYDHDDANRLSQLSYPATTAGTETIDYHYNLRGQLIEVYNPDDGTTAPLATYSRRDDGLISKLRYDNHPSGQGAYTNYFYDAGKRSTGRFHYNRNGGWMDKNQYGYDSRSRRIWHEHGGGIGDRFAYDPAGQVIKADYGISQPDQQSSPLLGNRSCFAGAGQCHGEAGAVLTMGKLTGLAR